MIEAYESTALPSASGDVYNCIDEVTSPESGYNSAKDSKDSWSFGSTGSYVSDKSVTCSVRSSNISPSIKCC
jgi:hypothetical protein